MADEREVLAGLPQDRGGGAEADRKAEDHPATEPQPEQEEAEGTDEGRPVDVMVHVVPPADRVVKIERLAQKVDQEREAEQRASP